MQKSENLTRKRTPKSVEHHKVQTGYWETKDNLDISAEYLEAAYFAECQKNNTRPLQGVISQLRENVKNLNFKGVRLDLPQVKAFLLKDDR